MAAQVEDDDVIMIEAANLSNGDLHTRIKLLENDIKVMQSERQRLNHQLNFQEEKIKENRDKIKVNKTLPYLVSNVVELLDINPEGGEEDEGSNVDQDALNPRL